MSIVFSQARRQKIKQISVTAPRIFSEDSVGDACFIYPGLPRAKTLKITWKATMWVGVKMGLIHWILLLFGHFGFSQEIEKITFDTWHPVSSRGLWRLRLHRFIALTAGAICYFILLLCFVMLPLGLLMIFGAVSKPGETATEDFRSGWHLALAAAGLMAGCLTLGNVARRYGLPGALRHIAEWPLELARYKATR